MIHQTTAARTNRSGSFTGTTSMLRLMLRLDRISLPIWVVSIAAFAVYYGYVLYDLYATQEELAAAAQTVAGPIGALLVGPGYGFDDLTQPRFLTGGYGLYIFLPTAFMSILSVVRHTRAEEASGRAELLRANVLGKYATLTSALLLTVGANVVLGVAITVGLMQVSSDFVFASTALFAASNAAVGIVFAAITALIVQLTENPGAAKGAAIGALATAFIVRGVGDMANQGGSLISWFSPLGWSQQTAPFVLDRWWPLLLSWALSLAVGVSAYLLSTRRDVGAGVFAPRPGPAYAADWVTTPFTFAILLRRSSLMYWALALMLTGLLMGGLTHNVAESVVDMPAAYQELFGEGEGLVAAYLNVFSLLVSLTIGAFVINCIQFLRAEEFAGRVDTVLATATGRAQWFASWILVIAFFAMVLHLVSGVALGLGAWASVGDRVVVLDAIYGHLTFLPATFTVLGVAAIFYGLLPRAVGVAWVPVVYGFLAGVLGPVLTNLPSWTERLSLYSQMAQIPVEPFRPLPAVVCTVIGVVLAAVGTLRLQTRDINVR